MGFGYRFAFNGKELDTEGMGGGGSTYDYGFRIYNPAIGKFLSVDPLTKSYPWYTPYQFAGNKPIGAIDLDGLEERIVHADIAKNALGRSMLKVANETSMGQEFIKKVESQSAYDVYYVPFHSVVGTADGDIAEALGYDSEGRVDYAGGASGMTKVFSSLDEVSASKKSNPYSYENVNTDDIKKSFEDGKKVIVILIADKHFDKTQVKEIVDPKKSDAENAKKLLKAIGSGAKTVLHEQTAHAENSLKGIAQSKEQTLKDHKSYNGKGNKTSPTETDVETSFSYNGTPVKKASQEVNKAIETAAKKL
jgi:RHS repeat-associated protein